MTRRRSGAAGFTLLEMIVVVAVLGLIAGLVLTRGPARSPGLEARLGANALAGVLRAARAQAIAADRPVAVAIDGPDGIVRAGGASPVRIGAALAATRNPIVFLPDGSAGAATVTVAAGPVRKAVAVDWLTGRVSIADAP